MSINRGGIGSFWMIALCTACISLGACGGSGGGNTTASSAGNPATSTAGSTTASTTGSPAASTVGSPSTGAAGSPAASATGAFDVGVFSGGSSPQTAAGFETWLGRKSDFNVDFFSYQEYTGSNTLSSSAGYIVSVWNSADRPDRNMLFSVPLATLQDTSLSNVASGVYDADFLQTAQYVAEYYPKAIIRLGWEFNGSFFPWAAAGRAQDYINAFRRVAQIFKSVSPDFRIDWCPNIGINSIAAELAYPGDDVVDVIGMDVYDDWNYSPDETDPSVRWNNLVDEDHGLTWQQDFATMHGKPMSFPEWAVNHDDSYFIQQMYAWITGNNFAYVSYWSSNSSFQGELQGDQYPSVSSAYMSLFAPLLPGPP